jgi:hypothetical protein
MPGDPQAEIARRLNAARANGLDPPSPLRIVDPRCWHGQAVPERRWIVPNWIPRSVVTGLYGPGGTGKSLLAMQLLTATALGKPWLGMPAEPLTSVIGVFCEDDEEELHRRQAAIKREIYDCDFADPAAFCCCPGSATTTY